MIEVVGWPLVGGIGLLVLLIAQPLGRPTPSLAQRLATLRPDPQSDQPPRSSFASPTLERLLAPHSGPPGGCCCTPLSCAACPPAG